MDKKVYKHMNWPEIEAVVYGECSHPFSILGATYKGNNTLIQGCFPSAKEVYVVFPKDKKRYKMELADEAGYFATIISGKKTEYSFAVVLEDGTEKECLDPYQNKPCMDKKVLEKYQAGILYNAYDYFGAHPMEINGIKGVQFMLWAPNAMSVSVVGDFNAWNGLGHQMEKSDEYGVFMLFIPGMQVGDIYKYAVKEKSGKVVLKADPYGFASQFRPDNASVVADLSEYEFKDEAWKKKIEKTDWNDKPVSIYELYLGSFKKNDVDDKDEQGYKNYRELAKEVAEYVIEMGYTHIELLPIMEHPLDESWGYQTTGYYAPTSRYGSPADFMYFVNYMHEKGIGVILDWAPAHFPKDEHGLAAFDGTCLYEHQDPRKGVHPDWGTLIYNYGRKEVSNFLIANALFWVEKYHVDGIRMDAVASMLYLDYGRGDGEWIPNIYGGNENLEAVEFIKHLNSIMHKKHPQTLMIAEESTAWPRVTGSLEEDGLGFTMKWNMGFMNDYLSYIKNDPYFRSGVHNDLTFSMIYQYSEQFVNVFSHDEVVHGKASMLGKMPGERKAQFANLRATYAYMMTHPGKKLLFMGQDIGEYDEWNEKRQVEWELLSNPEHAGIQALVKDLNDLYKKSPALYLKDNNPEGFEWINCIRSNDCMLSFVRRGETDTDLLLCVVNFANVEQEFKVGVPYFGKYKEILNTNAKKYGGDGKYLNKQLNAARDESDGREYSFWMKSAPLSMQIFSYTPYSATEIEKIAESQKESITTRKTEELYEAKETYQQTEKRIKKEYQDRDKERKVRYENDLARLKEEYEQNLVRMEQEFEADKERMKQDYLNLQKSVRAEHEERDKRIRKELSETLAFLEQEKRKELKKKK